MHISKSEQHVNSNTQQRILDAAISCIKQWGVEKTSLNDIAKQAGVTRPTVYSYFPNKNDVIRSALLQSGLAFRDRLICHIQSFDDIQQRLIESVAFAVEELPKEPYLALIMQADLSVYINKDALSSEDGFAICLMLFEEIFKNAGISDDELKEITEFTVRITLSLLILKGPIDRDADELRSFLTRRLLPSLGL